MDSWIAAKVVAGHRVASGQNGDSRFPGGTLRMQLPHFKERGLDLTVYHLGTVNVAIQPWRYLVQTPRITFRQVKWHPVEPAEDFSFIDVLVRANGIEPTQGLIYYPHPETKPEHFQNADVLEILLPWIDDLHYGQALELQCQRDQLTFAS